MTGPFVLFALLLSSSIVAPPDPQTVIGGEASPSCAWPSVVSLGGCTGTLIHPEVVVYAAHCGDEIPSVWFGELSFQGPGRQVDTSECHVNPGYLDGNGERHEDWAFCRLAEPVTDVPIVPPLMGCETTLLTPGRRVTLVGFGLDENDISGIKRQGETDLQWIDENGAVLAGNGEVGSCFGDSGGPIFLELPDGSWRAFGIVSGGNSCGFPAWYSTIHTAIPSIEQTLGIDVTPCHYASGGWNPSPACGDFPTEPWDGEGKTWTDGCAGGPALAEASSCGPGYDDAGDDAGPLAAVIEPAWGDTFESDDSGFASVDIEIDASDLPSGVERVVLRVNGMLLEESPDRDPPFRWSAVALPQGVWEITARATDWAGNESVAPIVMIGVDEEPPAMPEPTGSTGEAAGTSSGEAGGTAGDESTGGPGEVGTSTGTLDPSGSASSGADAAASSSGDDGCGCTASEPGGASGWLWLLALGLGRRRRRASLALGAALTTAGCSDDAGESGEAGTTGASSSSSSTGLDPASSSTSGESSSETSASTSTGMDDSSSGESSSTTTDACVPGTEGCTCTEDAFGCDADLRCELDTCIVCPAGTLACHCIPAEGEDAVGTCEGDLLCAGGLCASPPPCPFVRNGVCDEDGACFPGSDTFDCCPVEPGVCEEVSAGGVCPDGSDPDDCVTEPPK